MPRILGLDFGTKRVGAAVSDPRRLIATPLEVHERTDPAQDARHYKNLVGENEVDRIVIGLPLHTGGARNLGLQGAHVRHLARRSDRTPRGLLRRALTPRPRRKTP